MDFSLSDEQQAIRAWVRSFVLRELVPLETEVLRNERAGRPGLSLEQIADLRARARRSGFWGLQTPAEYGGMGLDCVTAALVFTELGRTFVPFSFGGAADNILFACTPEQAQTYLLPTIEGTRRSCFALTEPGAGSDAKAIRMSARREGADYVLNGEKVFISHGEEADYALVFAVTDAALGADGGITCFLVDREMGWTSSPIDMMGEWTPSSLSFQDVRVPAGNVLGDPGHGFRLAMEWIGRGRWSIPASAVGAAERLLEMALAQARSRVTFGQPLASRQAIQWMIADSATDLEATRWLTLHVAWLVDQGSDARHRTAMAKLHGAVMANQVVDRVLQIHGGMGLTRELPVERWFRELRVLRIFEGTDEIQRRSIARNLLDGHVRIGDLG
jgi:alkylation response protein AidB-like acyl-CoA dehydrogenase